MSAFTTTPVLIEKKVAKGARQSDTIGSVYTRMLNIKMVSGASGDTIDTGVKMLAGTVVLAAYIKCSETNTNSTTVQLKATTSPSAVFVAATAPVATGWTLAVVTTGGVGLLGLDDTITLTLGVGATPASWNVQVALVCAEIDVVPTPTTYTA
jgi:hypothetical protein